MLSLGLDTSNYTTSAALCSSHGEILQSRRLLPVKTGERGLRQSEAVFAHVRQLAQQVENVMKEAKEPLSCVCVSISPRDGEDSYMPVFSVGEMAGRAIAAAHHVPFFTTTHQRGHIRAAKVQSGLEADRFLALHLSGGTTDVLLTDGDALTPLGTSMDLHAGQLVDRVGVAMGLPFPSGPHLEKLAVQGRAQALVPVSMDEKNLQCHLSGAEAQLLRMVKDGYAHEDIAAEVYSILCRTVLRLLKAAADQTGTHHILLAGGVASSRLFRELVQERNEKRRLHLKLHFGMPEYSGDNAVGVALIGLEKLQGG
ncbi:MAG: O-sialoglycoprotein endopeptidase [Clostridia bacterium]|nr:O-sialoglycoprotein endopeptidase [Clostridia bacterium]